MSNEIRKYITIINEASFEEYGYDTDNNSVDIDENVNFIAIGAGDGFWGFKKNDYITIYKIEGYVDLVTGSGSMNLYFQEDLPEGVFPYTDSGILNTIKFELTKFPDILSFVKVDTISYSEQGLQDSKMINLDIELKPDYQKALN